MIFNRHTLPNLGKAIVEFVGALFRKGPLMATPEVATERLARCHKCPHFEPASSQCKICTCFMNVKTLLAVYECPVKVWGRQTKFSTGL